MAAPKRTQKKRRIDYLPVADLVSATRNGKDHADELIRGSINRFGVIETIVLDERTGRIVGGHGRRDELLRAEQAGDELPDGVIVGPDGRWLAPVTRGWQSSDDVEADAAAIALNRIGEVGGWKRDVGVILSELAQTPRGLDGLGFTPPDLDNLPAVLGWDALDALAARDNGSDKEASTGDLLALVDVTIGEPSVEPARGSHWQLGEHVLCVNDVMTEHTEWAPYLEHSGVVFCPYAGPFVVLAEKADAQPLLLVQPDPYIAGHIIDKWASIDKKRKPQEMTE